MITGQLPTLSSDVHHALIVLASLHSWKEGRSSRQAGQINLRGRIAGGHRNHDIGGFWQTEPASACGNRSVEHERSAATGGPLCNLASGAQQTELAFNTLSRHVRLPR